MLSLAAARAKRMKPGYGLAEASESGALPRRVNPGETTDSEAFRLPRPCAGEPEVRPDRSLSPGRALRVKAGDASDSEAWSRPRRCRRCWWPDEASDSEAWLTPLHLLPYTGDCFSSPELCRPVFLKFF